MAQFAIDELFTTGVQISGFIFDRSYSLGIAGQVLTATSSGVMWQADSSNSDFSSLSGQIAATGTLLNNKINSLSGYVNDTFLSGNGVANYVPRWSGTKLLVTGNIYDNGANVGIGTNNPNTKLRVAGSLSQRASGSTAIQEYKNIVTYSLDNYGNGGYVVKTPFQIGTSYEMAIVHVKGYGYGDSKLYDFKVIFYDYGPSSAPISYSLVDLGNDGSPKYLAKDATNYLQVCFGNTTDVNNYYYRFTVDCITTRNDNDYSQGWGMYQTTGTNFGFASTGIYTLASPINFNVANNYVGIGKTNPTCKLDVAGTIRSSTNEIYGFGVSDNVSLRASSSVNVLGIYTSNVERLRLAANGYFGVGTDNPSTLLSIGGAGSTSVLSGLTFGADSQANLYRISSARIKTDGNFTIDGQGGGSTSLVLNRSSTSSENGMAFNTAGVTDWYFYVNDATSNLQIQRLGENDATPRVRFDGSNSNVLFNLGGGNVGVGTDSPNYKLDVIGSVRASGELISEGNNTRLSLFRNNGINYFDWASGQSLYLSTQTSVGGAGRNTLMTVTSGGRVGIGSVNPTDYLDFGAAGRNIVFAYAAYGEILNSAASIIGNNVKASPTGNSQVRRFASTPDAGNFIKLIYNKGVTFHTNLTSALNTDISEDANERMRINLSGDVGIGTVNPNGRLHVVSPDSTYAFSVAGATKGVRFNLNSAGTYIQGVDNTLAGSYQSLILGGSDLYFQTNGLTNAVYIDSSGDVGINTTSPTSKLHVVETTATGTRIQLGTASTNALMNSGSTNDLLILNAPYGNNPASTSNIGAKWGIKFIGATDALSNSLGKTSAIYAVSEDILGYNRGTSLAFYTNQLNDQTYAERMRIYHNGNVGIGTTSPAALLSVGSSGSTSAASGLAFGNDTSANLYRSAASTIKTDGSLEVAVKIVSPTITSLSGNLAATGSTLDTKINSLSGYSNANFATILNLAATGSTLDTKINSLSGYSNSNFISGQGVANWTARWNGTKELITGSIYDIGTAVGIGTLTPSTKLAVEGGSISTVNATGTDVKLSFDVRSLVGGAVGFNNAAATNVYGVATGLAYFGVAQAYPIAFTTNGTERLRIAAGGNVGIGSTNPAYKLDVNGSAGFTNGITVNADASSTSYFVGANGTRPIIFQNNTASAYDFGFKFTDLNTFTLVGGNTLANPTTDLVSFTYDGKVGIGITVPLQKFQIDGTVGNPALAGTTQSGIFRISNTTDNAILDFGLRSGGNGAWIQSTDETSLAANYSLLLNPNGGNVGIGTTAPVQKLDIRGYVVSDVNSNAIEGGFFLGNNSHGIRREAGSNDVRLHTNGGDLIFGAAGSGSQQVTLKNGGNLGIGTTNPTAKLQIENSGTISSVATVRLIGSTGNNAGSQIEFYKAQTPEASIGLASAVTGGLSDDLILLSANPNSIVLSAGASGISVFKADGKVGIGTINPQTLLSLGGLGSTSAASGLTFGGDAQANLYRSAEDTIRTDGSLVVNGNFNTNTTTVTTLNINAGTLPGIPAGSTITGFTYAVNNGNVSQINLVETRFQTGSDWTTASTRIQKRTDVTNQAYIEFNPSGASYGMALGVGANSNVEALRILSNGSIGIGTTNPATKLHVYGAGGGFEFGVGSSNCYIEAIDRANTSAFINTSYYTRGTGYFAWYNGSYTERMRIASNGNVGINSTTPTAKLSINKGGKDQFLALDIANNDAKYAFYVDQDNNGSNSFSIWDATNSHTAIRYLPSSGGYWQLYTNNIERVRIDNNGNVGIGTTNPLRKLHITSSDNQLIFISGSTAGTWMDFQSSTSNLWSAGADGTNGFAIFNRTTNANAVTVANGGNIGIGTTNPSTILTIAKAIDAAAYGSGTRAIDFKIYYPGFDTDTVKASIYAGVSAQGTLETTKGYLAFLTSATAGTQNLTEKLRIEADGNVGIGTTNPLSKFVVNAGTVNTTTYTTSEARIADGSLHLMKTVAGGIFESIRAMNMDTTAGTTVRVLAASTSDPFNNANGGKVFIDAIRTATNMDLAFSLNDVAGAAPVERVRFMGNGNVGIGTTAPVSRLHIYSGNGTSQIFNLLQLTNMGTPNQGDIVGMGFAAGESTQYGVKASIGFVRTGNFGIGDLAFYANRTTGISSVSTSDERLRIQSNGNVGIGLASSLARLHIMEPNGANDNVYQRWSYTNNVGTYDLLLKQTVTANVVRYNFSMINNSTSYLNVLVLDRGNVGIGTTNPDYQLTVIGANQATANVTDAGNKGGSILVGSSVNATNQGGSVLFATLNDAGNYTPQWAIKSLFLNGNGSGIGDLAFSSRRVVSNTSLTESVRFTYDGKVGIGVTNPIEKLMIAGNIQLSGSNTSLNFNTDNAGNGNISFDGSTFTFVSNSNSAPIIFSTTSTERARITNAGRLGIGTSSPVSLLSVGGPGSTTAASGLTFGAEAASNIYRSSTNQLKTDGSFVVSNTLVVGGGENGIRILKDGSDSISSTLYLANAANTRAYNFQQNAAGTNLALWTYNSANTWQNSVNFNYNGSVGIGTTTPSGKLHIVSTIAGETVLRADGTNGTLFSVVDDLSDSLMSVNNSAGLPVLEVFADDRIVAGQYGSGDFVLVNNKVGIGTSNPSYKLDVNGSLGINASTSDTNWPFVVSDNSSAGSRYGLNKAGSMGFNYADAYAQLQLLGANGAYIDFTNSVGGDSNARLIYYAGARLDLTYGFITNGTISLNSNGIGIGTTSPVVALDVVGPIGSFPIAAGTTTTGVNLRLRNSNSNLVLDVGGNGGNGNWLQSTSRVDLSLSYPLLFNPNGGNVGIGTIAPTGVLTIHSNGTQLRLQTASGPGAYFANISSIYDATHPFTIAVANNSASATEFFGIYADGGGANNRAVFPNGNVGIGLTNPSAKLHVRGEQVYLYNDLNTNNTFFYVRNSGAGNAGIKMKNLDGEWTIIANDRLRFIDDDAGVERLSILSNGNVGVGLTIPQKPLDVISSSNDFVTVGARGLGVGNWCGIHFGYREDNNLYRKSAIVFERTDLTSNNAQGKVHILNGPQVGASNATLADAKITINEAGNVGIGSVNPTQKLDVAGYAMAGDGLYRTSIYGSNGGAWISFGDTGVLESLGRIGAYSALFNINSINGDTSFQYNSSEKMRITTAGNVGIGVTNPGVRLQVVNTGSVTSTSTVRIVGATGNGGGSQIEFFKGASQKFSIGTASAITGGLSDDLLIATLNPSSIILTAGLSGLAVFKTDGKVGIGTASPTTLLSVGGPGSTSAASGLTFGGDAEANLYRSAEDTIKTDGSLIVAGNVTATNLISGNGTANYVTKWNGTKSVANSQIFDDGTYVGVNTITNTTYRLQVNGSFAATTKSFDIVHPTISGKRLTYASLEGPENGVYYRGQNNNNEISLPHYWSGLVHDDSITVNLTAVGRRKDGKIRNYSVDQIGHNKVYIYTDSNDNIYNYYYTIFAERKDVSKLVTERDME